MISHTFLWNFGEICSGGIEVLGRLMMTQSLPVSDAGSSRGGRDRHQLSMSNHYGKEKVDAGR